MCNYSYQALEVKLPQRVFKYVEFNNSVCVMCEIYTYDTYCEKVSLTQDHSFQLNRHFSRHPDDFQKMSLSMGRLNF